MQVKERQTPADRLPHPAEHVILRSSWGVHVPARGSNYPIFKDSGPKYHEEPRSKVSGTKDLNYWLLGPFGFLWSSCRVHFSWRLWHWVQTLYSLEGTVDHDVTPLELLCISVIVASALRSLAGEEQHTSTSNSLRRILFRPPANAAPVFDSSRPAVQQ